MLFAGARILEGVFEVILLYNYISLKQYNHLQNVFINLFQSFSAVALLNVFMLWAPPHERSRLVLLGFVGAYIGIFVNYWLCGYIAEKWGYEAIFTVTGHNSVDS